jgi:TonB family protein
LCRMLIVVALSQLGCVTSPIRLRGDEDFAPPCATKGLRACRNDCDAGDANACLVAAVAYSRGEVVEPNLKKQIAFEERACEELKSDRGCAWLGASLSRRGPQFNPVRAKYLRRLACEGEYPPACYAAAGDAAVSDGFGLTSTLLERGCEREHWPACAALGDMLRYGLGVERNPDEAARRYALACEHGEQVACHNVDPPDGVTRMTTPAVPLVRKHAPDLPYGELRAVALPGFEGVVEIEVCVGGSGTARHTRVERSSGITDLDEIAERTVDTWRFAVADVPTAALVCRTVRFEIRMLP